MRVVKDLIDPYADATLSNDLLKNFGTELIEHALDCTGISHQDAAKLRDKHLAVSSDALEFYKKLFFQWVNTADQDKAHAEHSLQSLFRFVGHFVQDLDRPISMFTSQEVKEATGVTFNSSDRAWHLAYTDPDTGKRTNYVVNNKSPRHLCHEVGHAVEFQMPRRMHCARPSSRNALGNRRAYPFAASQRMTATVMTRWLSRMTLSILMWGRFTKRAMGMCLSRR